MHRADIIYKAVPLRAYAYLPWLQSKRMVLFADRLANKANKPHVAASSGMDVKTLQSIAGHSDIKMTLERYAHERENNIIVAGSLIGGVFRSM